MIPKKILSSFALQKEVIAPQPGRGVMQKTRQPKLQRSAALAVTTSVRATFSPSFFSSAKATHLADTLTLRVSCINLS